MLQSSKKLGRLGTGVACAIAALCASVCRAQEPAATPELKPNPMTALRAFEPAADQPYELGPGDEISLDFAGRPEMNGKKTLGPDGRITLPLAGQIMLADKTREGAAEAISAAFMPFYSRVSLTVSVDRYSSNRVLLLGSIEHPGVLTFDAPPTLLEVMTRGGGGTGAEAGGHAGDGYSAGSSGGGGGGGGQTQRIPKIPERVAIYRGTDKVMWVDVKGLLDSGSPLADLRLKRGDIIYVPSPSERYISILGQVQHPGALLLENNTTLPKLIAEAGGLTELAGHYPDIQIIQPAAGTTRVVSFKTLLQPGRLDLTLHSGDVIYVPESGFNRSTYVLQRLSPLVTMFTAAAFFTK